MGSRCDIGTLVSKDHNKQAVLSTFAKTKLPVTFDLGTIIPTNCMSTLPYLNAHLA